MEDIAEKVREIIAKQLKLPIEKVGLKSHFVKDLGADSLSTVEIVIALEEAFDCEIPDVDSERMNRVGDVVKYLEKHLPEPKKTESEPMEQRKQFKLLCVDDEEEITEFLHDYFKERGFEPYRAKSGEQALELTRQHNPDIVLLDVCLPGGPLRDGIEILKEIKKHNPAIKVLMVTGISDKGSIVKAMELGASGYITKPLDLEYLETEVMKKIQETLSGSSGSPK